MKRLFCLLFCLLGLCIYAQDYSDFAELKSKAESGDINAQSKLGAFYYSEQNYSEAIKWLTKAAENGDAVAQFNLAICYSNGQGVPKDDMETLTWIQKAAEQGLKEAQYNLGFYYYNGIIVPQDYSKAIIWYKKAAEQGLVEAQYNIGLIYNNLENYSEAVYWFKKAAEQGYAGAQFSLGNSYRFAKGVPNNDIEAVKWYRKAAEQGYAIAQNNLGYCYEYGIGTNQDISEAVKWFRKAAEQGLAEAQCCMGGCYDYGLGVVKNHKEALNYYTKSAEQGQKDAMYILATKYENGEGVPHDIDKAVKLYIKSAELGKDESQIHLSKLCKSGIIALQDYPEITKWLDKAEFQEFGEIYKYIGNKVWQEFRSQFPDPYRVLACQEIKDGGRVYIISEPPENISLQDIEQIFDGYIHFVWTKSKDLGYDGMIKDIVVYTDGIPTICHEQIICDLNELLYNTTYKASYLSLPYEGGPQQKFYDTDCAFTINDKSLHDWVFGESNSFLNLLNGTKLSSQEIFLNQLFGVFASNTDNIVMWTMPFSCDISNYKDLIHIFGIESDMILGAVYSNNVVGIIGRKRGTSIISFPPLRTDEVIMLAASGNDIGQSLDIGTPSYLRIDGEYDWCPAWVSNNIRNSEYAHLMTITDCYMKFWLFNNRYEILGYDNCRPNSCFNNKEFNDIIKEQHSLIFNWNTDKYAFVTYYPEGTIMHFRNIGCLNFNLINDRDMSQYSTIEKDAYDFFLNSHSTEIFRVAQYTMLYEIFKSSKITAKNDSSYNIDDRELPFLRSARTILESVKNLSDFEIDNISKKIYKEALAPQLSIMTEKDIVDFVNEAGEGQIIREKWEMSLQADAEEKAKQLNITYEQYIKSDDYKVMKSQIENEINKEILVKFDVFNKNIEEFFSYCYIVGPVKRMRTVLSGLSSLEFEKLCRYCASPRTYKETDLEHIIKISSSLYCLSVIAQYSEYFGINIKDMFDDYVRYHDNRGKTWFKTPSVIIINNYMNITKITPKNGIVYYTPFGGHGIYFSYEETRPSTTTKGQQVLHFTGDPLRDAYYYAQKAVKVSNDNPGEMLEYVRKSKEALSQEITSKKKFSSKEEFEKYNNLYNNIERRIYSEMRKSSKSNEDKDVLMKDFSEVKTLAELELANNNLSEKKKGSYTFIQKVAERQEKILKEKKVEDIEDEEIKQLKKEIKRLQMTLAELKKNQ